MSKWPWLLSGVVWWHHCRLRQCRARLSLVEALVIPKEARVRAQGYGGATVCPGHVRGRAVVGSHIPAPTCCHWPKASGVSKTYC